MAEVFGRNHLEIDKFLLQNGQPYVSQILYNELQEQIDSLSCRPIILDGVCLLEVLERCNLKMAAHVYIKSIGEMGRRAEVLNHIEQGQPEQMSRYDQRDNELCHQIAVYHRDYKPMAIADFVIGSRFIDGRVQFGGFLQVDR